MYDPSKQNEGTQMATQLLMALIPHLPPLSTWGIIPARNDTQMTELGRDLWMALQNTIMTLSQFPYTPKLNQDILACFDRVAELAVDPNGHPGIVAEHTQALMKAVCY
jgi:hypothetical protein